MIYAPLPWVISLYGLERSQMEHLNGCLGWFHEYLEPEMAWEIEVVHGPKPLPGKTDSRSCLQNAPRLIDMLYDMTYSMFGTQSDCQGGDTPSRLCYEACQRL